MSDRDLNIKVSLSAANKLSAPVNAAKQSAAGLASQIKATQDTIKQLQGQSKTFERLSVAVKKDADAYEKAKAKVKALRDQFPKLNQQTEAQKKALAAARLERGRFSRALDKEKQKLKTVSDALQKQGISLKQADSVTAQITHRTEQYNRQLSEQKRRLNAVTHAQNQYAKAKEVRNKLAQGGAVAMAGGSGVVYGASRFLKPGFEFDAAMSEVQARTGLAKDSPQLKALREQAKAIGGADIYSPKDAAAAQKFLAMAGLSPESIQAALPAVLRMGLAGDMGLSEVADKGSNILAKFGLGANQMGHLADVFSVTVNKGKTSMNDLSDAMVKASPTAHQLGVNLESLSAMVGVLSQNDIKGASAGTLLSGSLMKLVSPVKKGQSAIDALGVSVKDNRGRIRDMGDILGDVGKSLRQFDEVSQTRILKDLFGAENAPGMKALIDAVTQGRFKELQTELNGAAGAAKKLADVKADNFSTDVLLLGSAWELLRVEVADTVKEALRPLVQMLTRVLDGVTAWVKEHPKLTQLITLSAMAAGALVAILGALALTLAAVIVPLASLRLGFFMLTGGRGLGGLSGIVKKALPFIGRLGGVFTRLGGVATVARGAVAALGVEVLALTWPVALAVGAIVAAGLLIYKYWQPIKLFFAKFWDGFLESLEPIKRLFERVFGPMKPMIDKLSGAVSDLWQGFKDLLEPVKLTADEMERVSNHGEQFGKNLGRALFPNLMLARDLAKTISWILEKLGIIPSLAEQAAKAAGLDPKEQNGLVVLKTIGDFAGNSLKADQKQQAATQNAMGALGSVMGAAGHVIGQIGKKVNENRPKTPVVPTSGGRVYDPTQKGLGRDSVGGTSGTDLIPRDKLGEIVFKHHPDVIKLRGMYQEPLISQKPPTSLTERLKGVFGNIVPSIAPIQGATPVPVTPKRPARDVYQPEYNTFELNFYGVEVNKEKDIADIVQREINKVLQSRDRRRRSRLSDKD